MSSCTTERSSNLVHPSLERTGVVLLVLPDGVGIGSLFFNLQFIYNSITDLFNEGFFVSVKDSIFGAPEMRDVRGLKDSSDDSDDEW